MSIDGIPPPSLLYLLDVIMTHTQQSYYPRIIGVVFAAVRAAGQSQSDGGAHQGYHTVFLQSAG